MVRLTHLGQRFMLTTDPLATSIAYESVFRYLVVGIGDPSLDPAKYALALPVGAASSDCQISNECAQNGHSFRITDNILYCDVTIVRTWFNNLPAPVALREFGFSPNSAGTPLSAVGYFGASAPETRMVGPGEWVTVKLSLSVAVGPMTLTPTGFYLGGGNEYQIYYGLFASSSSLYTDLLRLPAGLGDPLFDWGVSSTGYVPNGAVALSFPIGSSLYASSRPNTAYSHPYAYLAWNQTGDVFSLNDNKDAIVAPKSRRTSVSSGYQYSVGVYFTLGPGASSINVTSAYIPSLVVQVQQ